MKRRRRRSRTELHVLRYVEGATPVHNAWAGTKILCIAGISLGLLIWPTWQSAGLVVAVLLAAFMTARLPRGVLPRLPLWVLWIFLIGAVLALASNSPPRVRLATVSLGIGGLGVWARLSLIGVEVLALAALVTWTTPLADLAPALGRLGWPFRKLRLPVDETVAVTALAIRFLPLLIGEMQVLAAARRTRRPDRVRGLKQWMGAAEEVIFVAMAASLRRARELGEAIEARGGRVSPLPDTHPVGVPDAALALAAAATVAAMALLS